MVEKAHPFLEEIDQYLVAARQGLVGEGEPDPRPGGAGRGDQEQAEAAGSGHGASVAAMEEPARFDERLEKGRDLFNGGCFFEAHDVWEDLWGETRGGERRFLEGLIHSAVGCYHLSARNYRGAESQLRLARDALAALGPSHRGLDVEGVLAFLDEYLERLEDPESPQLAGIRGPRMPLRDG